MKVLLKFSGFIDAITEFIGKSVMWLVLAMTLISAFNAVMRYTINYSSNAWLEVQWYLFAAIFTLMAGYALLKNAHIRIDLIAGKLSHKKQAWIDILGFIFFLVPVVVGILYLSLPLVLDSINSGEISPSPGGLTRWPVKILLPIGFFFLALQGLSEMIKKIGFLTGHVPDPYAHHEVMTEEEKLAAEIKAQQELKAKGEQA